MKEIFDWMREQCFENVKIGRCSFAEIYKIIDEAEAKWESECCEWEHRKYDKISMGMCRGIKIPHEFVVEFKICPYCLKRIKISEV